MTERMLAGAKKDFEKRLRNHFPYFRDESIVDGVMRDFEDAIRDNVPVSALPPANFPVGLIHADDYYDSELLAPKLALDKTSGWDGEV
ncbi:MAG: hypothetical protein A3D92_13145 [Bacteroidetes bacterium RIFCSPHIGHO2_02_FULL_44_7]|nr:MAG: hypothetical protein A3D92_13145 [Bacteroidetes bacterium RIFCSPHIGHO2_02_FULL_44_7]